MADQNYLDNYSPFDENGKKGDDEIPQIRLNLEGVESHPPPSRNTFSNARSNQLPSASVLDSIDESGPLTEEQLREYEENLDILDREITNLENQNRSGNFINTDRDLPPNWPSIYPIIHFDLNEIPDNLQIYVKGAFFCWFVMVIAFLLNWIGTLSLLSVSNAIESPGSKIALSTLYFFILVPLAFDLDTMSVYRAMRIRTISTFTYLKLFLALGFTCFFEFMLTLGMESSGSVGLISTIELFIGNNIGCGVFGLIVTLVMGASASLHSFYLAKLWKYYRGTEEGGHMETDLRSSIGGYLVNLL